MKIGEQKDKEHKNVTININRKNYVKQQIENS